jgi:hypothetical protein
MYMLLLLAVVLFFLLEPAAASNPNSIMDFTSAAAPLETFFSDPEGILNPICHYCAMPFFQCMHSMVLPRTTST